MVQGPLKIGASNPERHGLLRGADDGFSVEDSGGQIEAHDLPLDDELEESRRGERPEPEPLLAVEVLVVAGGIAAGLNERDSKDPSGPVLVFTPGEWRAFVEGSKMARMTCRRRHPT